MQHTYFVILSSGSIGPHTGDEILGWYRSGTIPPGTLAYVSDPKLTFPVEYIPEVSARHKFTIGVSAIIAVALVAFIFVLIAQRKEPAVNYVGSTDLFVARAVNSWSQFDRLPATEKSKERFTETFSGLNTWIDTVPIDAQPKVAYAALMHARQRYNYYSSVGSHAAGVDSTDLVPNDDPIKCTMWAPMWLNTPETLKALREIGFKRLVCGERVWSTSDVYEQPSARSNAPVCALWGTDPTAPGEQLAAVVWQDLELLRAGARAGRRTDDDAPLVYMALISKGGQLYQAGTKFTVDSKGDSWVKVVANDGSVGYVERVNCHEP